MDFHPSDSGDLLAYLIIGLPAIVAAFAAFFHQKKELRSQRDIAEKTLYEVKNDHGSNLRDDIDGMSAAIRDGFKEVHVDIHGLREEIRTERIERIEGDRRRMT